MVKMPSDIISLEDFDESINMLVYGDSGVGKTVFAGSGGNVLFLATEKGTISAARAGRNMTGKKGKVWKITSWEKLGDAYNWLRDNPDHGFDWVVVDSVTQMQHLALRWILDNAVIENSNRDPDIPAIQDHQKWQNMFKRFTTMFADLPVNVLFTATTMRNENEEGEDIVLPDIVGKGYAISQWVCAHMHVVGYMSVKQRGKGEDKKIWRRINFQTSPPYFGKDRYACLGEYNENGACTKSYIDNPNLQKIAALIQNSGNKESSPNRTSTRKRKVKSSA